VEFVLDHVLHNAREKAIASCVPTVIHRSTHEFLQEMRTSRSDDSATLLEMNLRRAEMQAIKESMVQATSMASKELPTVIRLLGRSMVLVPWLLLVLLILLLLLLLLLLRLLLLLLLDFWVSFDGWCLSTFVILARFHSALHTGLLTFSTSSFRIVLCSLFFECSPT
jgi:hypothetical protein